jgi:GNAT superfamily N-acetyltransferase
MKLTIDEATQSDVAEILALRLAVGARMQERYGDDRWAPPINEGGVLRLFKGPRKRKSDGETLSKILVGKIRGEIVALTRMQTKRPWAFDLKYFTAGAKAVYLGDVEVSPKWQGQGFGTQLMAAAVDHARAWSVDAVRTSAYDGAAGAGPFYAKCGFRDTDDLL